MTEHKLSESELNEIREEAEKLYPLESFGGRIKQNIYIKAITSEREKTKELAEGLEGICENFGKLTLTEIQRIATNSINNYKNNK